MQDEVQSCVTTFCRQLANLGQAAVSGQWGVDAFENKSRDILSFARRTGRLPEQREGDEIDFRSILHRDGSVLSAPTLSVSGAIGLERFCYILL
jgi:hypothetical protein